MANWRTTTQSLYQGLYNLYESEDYRRDVGDRRETWGTSFSCYIYCMVRMTTGLVNDGRP